MKTVQMGIIQKIAQKRAGAKDPDRIKLSVSERDSSPELKDAESIRLFSTMTGRLLVCITTDRTVFETEREKSFAAVKIGDTVRD